MENDGFPVVDYSKNDPSFKMGSFTITFSPGALADTTRNFSKITFPGGNFVTISRDQELGVRTNVNKNQRGGYVNH